MSLLQNEKEAKTCWAREFITVAKMVCFWSERERDFSLGFWAIRSSEFVGTRRKVALRNEAYAWAPVLRSFDKLREVRVLSYLSFTLDLSAT